jgi:hypothetical protein
VFVCARSGFKAYVSPQKAISLSAGLHEIRCSNRQSSTASNLRQGMRDQIAKSSIPCCWQKAVNTSVFLKSEHHSLGVPEKVIGDLDRNTVIADANIPPMCWDIVVQHVALLNACTSRAVCDPSITIC